jgi:hypothetical protein
MSHGTLYYWLDGGPLEADGPALPPIPRRRQILGKRRRRLKGDPVSLTARLWSTCERQARDTEMRLAAQKGPPDERDIRMLALLVRSLRDLTRLDAERAGGDTSADAEPDYAQEADALRAELSRRLDAMSRSEQAAGEG